MYKAYVKEKELLETYENEYGFGAYQINPYGKIFDIGDFYIKPEYRTGVKSTKLFDELVDIAIKNSCKKITCCVDTNQALPEPSLHIVLRLKFKFSHIHDGVIYFYKNI